MAPTFADGREEASFSRSKGITSGSKRGDDENAVCRKINSTVQIIHNSEDHIPYETIINTN